LGDKIRRPSMEEQAQAKKAQAETVDLARMLEVNKQITTLSAGATVLIATFLRDVFPGSSVTYAKLFVAVPFVLFFVAMVASVAAMLATTSSGLGRLGPPSAPNAAKYTRIAHGLFVLALIFFSVIAYVAVVTR
jgi:hypothetical protein